MILLADFMVERLRKLSELYFKIEFNTILKKNNLQKTKKARKKANARAINLIRI